MCRFIKGVKILRKPTQKYLAFWDTSKFLRFLCQWNIDTSSLKDISLKLCALLVALAVQRIHTLSLIDYKSIKFETSGTYIYIFEDLTVAKDRPCFVISLLSLTDHDPLGTAKLLKDYLNMTSEYRNNAYAGKLFLSYVEPHLSVTSNTLARWIRTVSKMSGIDITIFGAHSVRGASSSKAMELSASVDSILQAGD